MQLQTAVSRDVDLSKKEEDSVALVGEALRQPGHG